MKLLSLFLIGIFSLFGGEKKTLHDFKIQALNSTETLDLASFRGKKILVVNVASKCGYTPQYEGLQKLHEAYGDELAVIGFPCDQFMGQELETESLIQEFCTGKYNVTFPMTTMIEVKGKGQHEIYQWLTSAETNGKADYKVKWNFNKFLIDENGQLLDYFPSSVAPMSKTITDYLK